MEHIKSKKDKSKIDIEAFIRALWKYFNQISNYPKGNSNTFKVHIEEYHSNSLLYHLTNMKGNY